MCGFLLFLFIYFFFSSRRRHTRWPRDWSSDVCSSDLGDDPDHGSQLPAQQHVSAVPQGAVDSVSVPRRQNADARRPLGYECCVITHRSEERRVGKECSSRWATYPQKKKERKYKLR